MRFGRGRSAAGSSRATPSSPKKPGRSSIATQIIHRQQVIERTVERWQRLPRSARRGATLGVIAPDHRHPPAVWLGVGNRRMKEGAITNDLMELGTAHEGERRIDGKRPRRRQPGVVVLEDRALARTVAIVLQVPTELRVRTEVDSEAVLHRPVVLFRARTRLGSRSASSTSASSSRAASASSANGVPNPSTKSAIA